MNEDLRQQLTKGMAAIDARRQMFDDRKIATDWVELAKAEPKLDTTTHKGLQITLTRYVQDVLQSEHFRVVTPS